MAELVSEDEEDVGRLHDEEETRSGLEGLRLDRKRTMELLVEKLAGRRQKFFIEVLNAISQ